MSQESNVQDYPFPKKTALAGLKQGDLILNQATFSEYDADFGTLVVNESDEKDTGQIELPVVRIHSKSDHPDEPIFLFEGGPGGTNIKLDNLPGALLENHDLVRVGYQGVDGSVSLDRSDLNQALKETPDMLSHSGLEAIGNQITQITREMQAEGVILEAYNLFNVIEDMEATRKALEYEKINLSGGSYGGALVSTYAVRHPRSIRHALMSEPAFPFDMALAMPDSIDRKLEHLNTLWKANPECIERSADIVQTIRETMKLLPQTWQGIRIDPDKIKLMTFFGLYTQATTAQVFDAFAAAEHGDFSGLAFMDFYWSSIVDLFNWGDMLAKTYCTETMQGRDYESLLNSESSIIGSPLALLGWGLRQNSEWPASRLPEDFTQPAATDIPTLLIFGSKESAREAKEYIPLFEHGEVVVHEDMGQM